MSFYRDKDYEKDEYQVFVIALSDSGKAIQCCTEDDEEMANTFWLPMSQIEVVDVGEEGTVWTVEVPQWLAEDKGMC